MADEPAPATSWDDANGKARYFVGAHGRKRFHSSASVIAIRNGDHGRCGANWQAHWAVLVLPGTFCRSGVGRGQAAQTMVTPRARKDSSFVMRILPLLFDASQTSRSVHLILDGHFLFARKFAVDRRECGADAHSIREPMRTTGPGRAARRREGRLHRRPGGGNTVRGRAKARSGVRIPG